MNLTEKIKNIMKTFSLTLFIKKNISELLALFTLAFGFYLFKAILFKEVKADSQTQISIVECVKGLLFLLFGFYFGSSLGSKNKQEKLDKLEEEKPVV